MDWKNSSGYFGDPDTEEEFTVDTERCVKCAFENGKFTWPMVLLSNGTPVKIVYKLFTEEEKNLYRAYRGRGTSPAQNVKQKPDMRVDESEVVKYNNAAAAGKDTLARLKECDRILGVTQIGGVTYALCSRYGFSMVYHIPRAAIPDAEFKRLCEGTA